VYTSVFASIDELVGEIENHEALIKAAIKEQRNKIAAAKVQLSRVRSSEQSVGKQLAQLKHNEKNWTLRASKAAADDESKALACLQKRQLVRDQIISLEISRLEYARTVQKMSADVARCDEELKGLSQKHELLRARQTSTDALNVINKVGGSNIDELTLSFDRWETRITEGELNVDSYDTVDSLEETYIVEENKEQLRRELAQLLSINDTADVEEGVSEKNKEEGNKESGNE
jgi:phage shock protein A